MVRSIRYGTIVAILIGGVLGAGLTLPAARSQSSDPPCKSDLEQGENVSTAEVGDNGADEVRTTADAPTAVGLGGADCLRGRNGQENTLIGGDGRDELRGGNEDDDLNGGNNSDTLNGGDGDDHLAGGDGNNQLVGGAGDDVITSGGSEKDTTPDVIYGGDDADQIYVTGGRAEVYAGEGDDIVVTINGFVDTVDCGPGADQALAEVEDQLSNCEEFPYANRIRKPGLKASR